MLFRSDGHGEPVHLGERPSAVPQQPIDHGHEALGVGERDVEEAQSDHVAILAEGNATGQRRRLEREDPHDARQSTTLRPLVAAAEASFELTIPACPRHSWPKEAR